MFRASLVSAASLCATVLAVIAAPVANGASASAAPRVLIGVLAAVALAAASPASASHGAMARFMPDDAGSVGAAGGWRVEQWNFAGRYGIKAPGAWANLIAAGRPGGTGVTIAVLDTGVAYTDRPPFRRSPDLAGTTFVPGYDFVDDDPYPIDENGHGTHVASTVAEQTDNRVGLTGLAYGASVMPVRVLNGAGEGDPDVIAQGIRFAAEHGAKVINLSISFRWQVEPEAIGALLGAIDDAYARGALVVAAAGNAALPFIPYPAESEHALAVGATTEYGCVASYSDVGSGLDVVAPGGGDDGSRSGDPRCRTGRPGRSIEQVTLSGERPDRFAITGYVGTSMAAPHVSAAAALVVASGVLGPDPPPSAIAERLERTARDLGHRGYDERYGWGLIDVAAATAPSGGGRAQGHPRAPVRRTPRK